MIEAVRRSLPRTPRAAGDFQCVVSHSRLIQTWLLSVFSLKGVCNARVPPISVRQPQPSDIVDDPMDICGVGSGFEGVFNARVRDGNGTELSRITITAGGTGILANYHAVLP